MFDPLTPLLYAVLFMAVFFGTVPLAVALLTGDKQRIGRILDLYIEVFAASAAAIIGALKLFRRKEPTELKPKDDEPKKLPPSETKQLEPPSSQNKQCGTLPIMKEKVQQEGNT